jgi:hypothetical protein
MVPIMPPAIVNAAQQQAENIVVAINLQRQQMEEALIRLGHSEVSTREFTNNGITSLDRLRVLTSESLTQLLKQLHRDNQGAGLFIPFFFQQYIQAIRFWTNRMYILGLPYRIEDVNEARASTWNEVLKAENESRNPPTDIIKSPDPFKKDTKWRPWKERAITYLNSKNGQGGIPLLYIVRRNDVPQIQLTYLTVHEQLVNCAILTGSEYNTNNGVVFDLLQSLTLNGPAWTWINAFQITRDCCNAWKSLLNFYEGDSTKTKKKQECYDAIIWANYQGPKHNFDFNTYESIHHLIRLGEPIPENKKVRDFLNGITDPQCANIKLTVLSNQVYMSDFMQTVNYIATAIDLVAKNSGTSARQIANLQTGRGRGRNQNTRGPGQDRGCHNPQGQDSAHENNEEATQGAQSNRGYTNQQWQNLIKSTKRERGMPRPSQLHLC